MQPTRRFWATLSCSGLLAGLSVVAGQPVLLLGSAAVAALLLARQWQFLAGTRAATDALDVEMTLTRTYVRQNEEAQVTLDARLAEPAPVDLTVSTSTPLPATGADRLEVAIPAGEQHATITAQLRWEIAGVARFEQPAITCDSRDGLFRETVDRGPTPSVVVEPPTPQEIHVGEGGKQSNVTFGGHRAGQTGQGIDPAELREYVPGDDVGDVDWKATARQSDLYVREYEVETDRRTILLFDHRGALTAGPEGETMLAYLREVALAFALSAEEFGDPLGLYTVGDEGLTAEFAPETGSGQYRAIRRTLHDLEPTAAAARRRVAVTAPAMAGAKATALAGDDSAFGTTLRPYFDDAGEYVKRIAGEPLFDVARTYIQGQTQGDTQVVIFTDDTDRATLRETVKVARGGSGNVVVLLAPRVLFEEGGIASLEAAYEEYVEFESFRRELAGIERVSAFEVAPDERIGAVLRAGRERR
jgi:uncharacterized protein (DUF58 family)